MSVYFITNLINLIYIIKIIYLYQKFLRNSNVSIFYDKLDKLDLLLNNNKSFKNNLFISTIFEKF